MRDAAHPSGRGPAMTTTNAPDRPHPDEGSQGAGRGRMVAALIYGSAWLPYVAAYVAVFLASGAAGPGLAVRGALANVLPDALLGPFALGTPRRFPGPEKGRGRFLALHAGLAAAFAVLATTGKVLLLTLDRARVDGAFTAPRLEMRVVPFQLFTSLLVYATLAGVAYALHNAARLRAESERAARAEALRARAELDALRARLNPHFLLNTLHSVLGLVGREPATAQAALERLGDLLRYAQRVHRDGTDAVGLREEWDFVASYLALEKLRLGQRLKTELRADADAFACTVPPFCLQPLVENAVLHAVAPRADGGRIGVAAERAGDVLRLIVDDDGPGMSSDSARNGGMGLRLVQERLAFLYRGRARFETGSPQGGGFRVVLTVPAAGPEDDE
jgi:signal transduction histidine kinase